MAKGPEKVKNMVDALRKWQGIERESINVTAEISEKTESPLIRMLMEIIRHDSLMHHRVQQFMIDSVTRESVTVTREDIGAIWESIEKHDQAEKELVALGEELAKTAWTPVLKQLLAYLITDEKKHDVLLETLNEIKKDLAKSSGA